MADIPTAGGDATGDDMISPASHANLRTPGRNASYIGIVSYKRKAPAVSRRGLSFDR
jgi:hypothetical protein